MRFPSLINPRAGQLARGLLVAAFGVVILAGACDDKHIGRPCQTGVPPVDAGSSGGTFATVTSPALECPSRICLLPGDVNGATSPTPGDHDGAFCTASCSTDDDCSDGEQGSKSDPNDTRCKGGFVCGWPTTVGPFCCQKMCICHDFLTVPAGGLQEPAACMPGTPTCH
jgi:hypothetical protein